MLVPFRSLTGLVSAGQLWWFAPIFSGGGYSSEAVDFLLGLHKHAWRKQLHGRLLAVQHGDMFDEEVLQVKFLI